MIGNENECCLPELLAPELQPDPEAYAAYLERAKKKKSSTTRGKGMIPQQQKKKKSSAEKKKKDIPALSTEQGALACAQAEYLQNEGCIRINNVLTKETAAKVREAVLRERKISTEQVVQYGANRNDLFGDLLLAPNRDDVLLPLSGGGENSPIFACALEELFGSQGTLRGLYEIIVGRDAKLYEFASLVSDPGAAQQTIHSDMPWEEECVLYTAFCAVQDITPAMGPTTFIPRSHTKNVHDTFFHNGQQTKNEFLRHAHAQGAYLGAGDIVVFDSRGLHAGGANLFDGGSTRVLFYFSFTCPAALKNSPLRSGHQGDMASMRPSYAAKPITLNQITASCLSPYKEHIYDPFRGQGDGLGPDGAIISAKRQKRWRERNAPPGSL
eukprot:CAMPEP_0197310682 /NCGR_PEP_ID=MMETSP0891-20130614/9250_1 /TAXON_ID=44058 ORGANISM="Aureoumbra lagunensis, Strain CCMP1510" /NCGR_SAMPLE_ID=MMETSP0891 /ASSEMBLY_ACC=CAM_ASM_000534 /LENGTH=383 /DNA_ID=CAMNT_0042796437 /DNA_START=202 /DNA_END=1353 /DNA_ORIENTATION=+